ncbi:MAG TPA: IPT/TIG domain-containing protein [Gammaproteobacteria bacterium]|jgi:hypothetical protein
MLSLRRLLAGLLLLCGLCLGGQAWGAAPACKAQGAVNISLSPCPLAVTFKVGTDEPVAVHVVLSGNVPSNFFVLLSQSVPVIEPGSYHLSGTPGKFQILFSSSRQISAGKHPVELDVKICADSACAQVLVDVGLPAVFDAVVPPRISSLTPASAKVGGTSFTLRVNGAGFSRDCKIRLGSTVLATTFKSASQLAARLNPSSHNKGQSYSVSVMPATGFVSNVVQFTFKNPLPAITAISPVELPAGTTDFALTVTGTGFTTASKINVNGFPFPTKFVSSTKLTTGAASLTNGAGGHSYPVAVYSDGPGGGPSNSEDITLDNMAPVITGISPSSTLLQNTSNITVSGSGFEPNSVIVLGGTPLQPFVATSTSLTAEVPGALLQSPAFLSVAVSTPAPGGGIATGPDFTVEAPAPILSWVSPGKFHVGDGDQVLTVRIDVARSNTVVEWNGTPLTLSRASATGNLMQFLLPSADLASAGTATVKALTPAPGGGSVSLPVSVSLPPPQIVSLSPGFTAAGSGDFTLVLYGVDFDAGAVVYWDGVALATTYVSGSELHAAVPAADIADAGVAAVTVVNPAAAGGTSLPASFAVDASGSAVVPLAQKLNDMDWDATRAVLYGSIPSSDAVHPHAMAAIDPIAASIVRAASVGSSGQDPNLVSVSADGSFVYFNVNGSIERYTLPNLTLSQGFTPGALITSLKASPLYSHVAAASVVFLGDPLPGAPYVEMDGSSLHVNFVFEEWDTMSWSTDGAKLYAGDNFNHAPGLDIMNFDLLAATQTPTQHVAPWAGTRLDLDAGSGLIYADDSTRVIDPSTLHFTTAVYPLSGVMTPDSTLGCAYFIAQTATQVTTGTNDYTLSCYSTADQTQTRSLVIPAVNGKPTKMLRWGNEGLVFITDAGYIYFVSGQVVTGN